MSINSRDNGLPALKRASQSRNYQNSVAYNVAYGQFVTVPGVKNPVYRENSGVNEIKDKKRGTISRTARAIYKLMPSLRDLFHIMEDSVNGVSGVVIDAPPANEEELGKFNNLLRKSGVKELFELALNGFEYHSKAIEVDKAIKQRIKIGKVDIRGLQNRFPKLNSFLELVSKMGGNKVNIDFMEYKDIVTELSVTISSLRPILDEYFNYKEHINEQENLEKVRETVNTLFVPFCCAYLENNKSINPEFVLETIMKHTQGSMNDLQLYRIFDYLLGIVNNSIDNVEVATELLLTSSDEIITDKQAISKSLARYRKVATMRENIIEQTNILDTLDSLFHGNFTSSSIKATFKEWLEVIIGDETVPVISRFKQFVGEIATNDKLYNPREIAVMIIEHDVSELLGNNIYDSVEYALRHAIVFADSKVWLNSGSLYDVLIGNLSTVETVIIPREIGDTDGIISYMVNQPGGPIEFLIETLTHGNDNDDLQEDAFKWVAALSPGDPNLASARGLSALLSVLVRIQRGGSDEPGEYIYERFQDLKDIVLDDRLERELSRFVHKKRIAIIAQTALNETGGTVDFLKWIVNESIDPSRIAIEGSRILADLAERLHNATVANIDELCDDIGSLWYLFTFLGSLHGNSIYEIVNKIDLLVPKLAALIDVGQLEELILDYRKRCIQMQVITMLNSENGPIDFIIECIEEEWSIEDNEYVQKTSQKWYELLLLSTNHLSIPGVDDIIDLLFGMADGIKCDEVVCYAGDILDGLQLVCYRYEDFYNAVDNYQKQLKKRVLLEPVLTIVKDNNNGASEFLTNIVDEKLSSMDIIKSRAIEFYRLLRAGEEIDECRGIINLFWSIGIGELTTPDSVIKRVSKLARDGFTLLSKDKSLRSSIGAFERRDELRRIVHMLVNSDGGCADGLTRVLMEEEGVDICQIGTSFSRDVVQLTAHSLQVARTVVSGLDTLLTVIFDLQTCGNDNDYKRSLIVCHRHDLKNIVNKRGFLIQLERAIDLQINHFDAYHACIGCNLTPFIENALKIKELEMELELESLDVQSPQVADALNGHEELKSLAEVFYENSTSIEKWIPELKKLTWLPSFGKLEWLIDKYEKRQPELEKIRRFVNNNLDDSGGVSGFIYSLLRMETADEFIIKTTSKMWKARLLQEFQEQEIDNKELYQPLIDLVDAVFMKPQQVREYVKDNYITLVKLLDEEKLQKAMDFLTSSWKFLISKLTVEIDQQQQQQQQQEQTPLADIRAA